MRKLLLITALLLLTACASSGTGTKVTLLHFSDYHSHALPFYSERGPSEGGIARAIGYLEREKKTGALVFSGGDMMNKGAPSWSDRYGCAEWPWLNGIVDAMAFGNHDVDYGLAEFAKCRGSISYPILGANVSGLTGSRVFEANGRRLGVLAVAGPDFPRLVKVEGLTFTDPVAAAKREVDALRQQNVDAIVMIGHQQTADDYALAKEVDGIDVIFGTHAHLTRELTQIPGTKTWFISPGQYLESISRVELTFTRDGLRVTGRVVPVDASMPESPGIAQRVAEMQRDLESDPKYRHLFEPITSLPQPLTVRALAARTLATMKRAAGADVALSTVSSFRGPLAKGPLTVEALIAALPYDNEIVVCTMTGAEVRKLLAEGESRRGGDSYAYVDAPPVIEEGRAYRVTMTDYLARVAYAKVLACNPAPTGVRVRQALIDDLRAR